MGDSVLPVCLQELKIGDSRDPSENAAILRKHLNPFSNDGGACKKMRRVSSASSLSDNKLHGCRMSLFGKKCVELKSPTSPCECISRYVPSKFDPSARNILQLKPTSFIRNSNIIRKSTLNFLRFQHAKKQDLSPPLGNTLTNTSKPNTFDESPSKQPYHTTELKPDPCSGSQSRDLFGRCVGKEHNFQSLISSCNDITVPGSSSLNFDTSTFRSRIRSYRRYSRRCTKSRSPDKSEDDETLSTVAKKLAATEISSARSASCSQQARLTANAYCDEQDISIDELASYFEDFVHIPKKMSLMAEQMYI